MKIDIYDSRGGKKEAITVDKTLFDLNVNPDLIHQALTVYLSNQRQSIAQTKTRAEVSGSGRKPWQQKGTGRARAGSLRSPIFRGGGLVHGPRAERNFKKKISQKMLNKALLMVLADRIRNKRFIVTDKFNLKQISTQKAREELLKLPLKEGKILLFLSEKKPFLELSYRNLPFVKLLRLENINIYDFLNFDYYLCEKETAQKLLERFEKQGAAKR